MCDACSRLTRLVGHGPHSHVRRSHHPTITKHTSRQQWQWQFPAVQSTDGTRSHDLARAYRAMDGWMDGDATGTAIGMQALISRPSNRCVYVSVSMCVPASPSICVPSSIDQSLTRANARHCCCFALLCAASAACSASRSRCRLVLKLGVERRL